MSIISEALGNWLGKYNKSVMCQGAICEQIPEATKYAMVHISEDSTAENKEKGASIREGFELGPVTTGTETRVPIIRAPNTIGTFHTHPNGWPTPSSYDIMEAIARGDKITCLGATDRWGTKIACYTPVEPLWSEYHEHMVSLLKDIREFNKKVSGKHKARSVPLRRLLRYIASPDYLKLAQEVRPADMTILQVQAANALEREKTFRMHLDIAKNRAEQAREVLAKAQNDFNVAVFTGDKGEIIETQTKLSESRLESRRLDATAVVEQRLVTDAESEAEIARIKSLVTPGNISQSQKEFDDAMQLLSDGEKLELRRQRLVDQLTDQVKLTGYKTEWRPAEKLAIDKCHLIWETGLPEDLPFEL